jgi:hypothetical protein
MSTTEVQVNYTGPGIVQVYSGAGVVQEYTVTVVIQFCRSNTGV